MMKRKFVGLLLGITLASGWSLVSAEEPPCKGLTPSERKALEMRRKEFASAGEKHYLAGRLAEATEALQKALQVSRRLYAQQDHPQLAESLNDLAVVLQARRKYTDAEPLCREAVGMFRRLYPKHDHPDLAITLNNLVLVLQGQERNADAEPLCREVLAIYRQLYPRQDHPHLAMSLNNLALVLQARGKYAEAEPLCRESLAMKRRLYPKQDHPDLAVTLNNVAFVLQSRGHYADAEPFYREALEMLRRLFPRQDHPHLAQSLNNLAYLLHARGQYADAEPLYREALAMKRRLYPRQDHPDLAMTLNNLALVLQSQGKYVDAEAGFRDVLAMKRRLYPRQDHPDLALSLNNLALVLQEQGQYTDAEPFARESVAMHRRLYRNQDHPHLATSLNNLALLLQAQGKDAEADSVSREALRMNRRLYPREAHPDLALILNTRSLLLKHKGQLAEAERLSREALAMRRRLYSGQDHPDLAASLNNLALVLQARGKDTDAEPLFRDALKMYQALVKAYASVRSEGEALSLAASYPLARDTYLSNARAVTTEPREVYKEVWSSKAALTRVYERRTLIARAATTNPKAAALLEQLTDRRRRRADLLLAPVPIDKVTREQRDADLAQHSKVLAALEEKFRGLLPTVERAERLSRATPADLQKVLSADTAVVDFLHYTFFEHDPKKPGAEGEKRTPRYLAFVLTKDKVAWLDLGRANQIDEAVSAWREAIIGGKPIESELPGKVRELVWRKVQQTIPRKLKRVYICPDLSLCQVPWAALPGDKPHTILLEDYAVAVVPHAVFLLDKLWPQERLAKRPSGVLSVGGVAYDAESTPPGSLVVNRGDPLLKPGQKLQWPALPGAAAEAKGVADAAARKKLETRILDGDKATASAVLAALPKAQYAHLATHGFFADASFRSAFHVDPALFQRTLRGERVGAGALSPMVMTGLVFAGANQPGTPGRGVVTGEALVNLNLSGLELAVLSACETGLGDVADGEGTFGLQRAFHLAGTRDVVASLWKVSDQATAALMALFYQNLWQKDSPPIEALRQAQLEIYRHPDQIPELAKGFRGKFVEVTGSGDEAVKPGRDGKAHPRLWAAFTLSGPGR
jgi:CHAT domain-containing protein/tetratricopeptide (TPR) repeat protein